jgi:sulfur relay (sulfurtransferase) DsrF/TusC family protein
MNRIKKGGDARSNPVSMSMGYLILKSILATGKGTKKKPYAVMRIEDEKDVLSALKKQARAQFLVQDKSRVFDLLQCSDGTEVYFDITLMFGRGIE